jgi:hypothetical protein
MRKQGTGEEACQEAANTHHRLHHYQLHHSWSVLFPFAPPLRQHHLQQIITKWCRAGCSNWCHSIIVATTVPKEQQQKQSADDDSATATATAIATATNRLQWATWVAKQVITPDGQPIDESTSTDE